MCDCIATTNAFLKDRNTQILVPMFGPQRPFVETVKLDDKKRGKPAMMFASNCPFCGEKYPDSKPATAEL